MRDARAPLGDSATKCALLLGGQCMAPEISRTPETNIALPSNMQAVAAGISTAASLQAKETIDL